MPARCVAPDIGNAATAAALGSLSTGCCLWHGAGREDGRWSGERGKGLILVGALWINAIHAVSTGVLPFISTELAAGMVQ